MDRYVEQKVVESCRRGDKSAYAALVKTYSRYVFAICFGMIGNSHDAEDVAQEVLLKGFTDIKYLRDNMRFKPWIGKVAERLCIDFRRRQKCRQEIAQEVAVERVANNQRNSEEWRVVLAALAKLKEEYRLPLVLYYLDGESTRSIGKVLQIGQNAVQARICRARKQLRKLLNVEGV